MPCPPSLTLEKQPRAAHLWCACVRLGYEAALQSGFGWVLLNAPLWTLMFLSKQKNQVTDCTRGFVTEPVNKSHPGCKISPTLAGITELLCQTTLVSQFRQNFIVSRCCFTALVGQAHLGRSTRRRLHDSAQSGHWFLHMLILTRTRSPLQQVHKYVLKKAITTQASPVMHQ